MHHNTRPIWTFEAINLMERLANWMLWGRNQTQRALTKAQKKIQEKEEFWCIFYSVGLSQYLLVLNLHFNA